ncbi:MAG TPA: PEGA domain-containing protein [Polyangiaceae bacterium]|nr:PEGA domain-containing protein [Polyangiaceae bacterium]
MRLSRLANATLSVMAELGRRHASSMHRVRRLAGALAPLALAALAASCASASTVSFRMTSNVPSASVTIDDQLLGSAAFVQKHGVAMPPGIHRVTVEKPGYFPVDKEVTAREGDAFVRLDVTLEKIPD